jgi:predicted esterase
MTNVVVRTIAATTHGRYLVMAPAGTPAGLVVGFHGYAENSEIHLEALRAIPGIDRWVVVAVQALHPFYTRDERIVANWMTRQDRDLAIADNLGYVGQVLESVRNEYNVHAPLAFVGFSQGGAMAYRAATRFGADAVIVLAADVPPDVGAEPGLRLPRVLLGRGTTDRWYTSDKHDADLAALARAGVAVDSCVFEGGHEWGEPFRQAASRYLGRLAGGSVPHAQLD